MGSNAKQFTESITTARNGVKMGTDGYRWEGTDGYRWELVLFSLGFSELLLILLYRMQARQPILPQRKISGVGRWLDLVTIDQFLYLGGLEYVPKLELRIFLFQVVGSAIPAEVRLDRIQLRFEFVPKRDPFAAGFYVRSTSRWRFTGSD